MVCLSVLLERADGIIRSAKWMRSEEGTWLKSWSIDIKRTVPHPDAPWTEGLVYLPSLDLLAETSGSWPPGTPSFIRLLNRSTGEVVVKSGMGNYFAEGVTHGGSSGSLLALTYQDHVAVELDQNLKVLHTYAYPWTGWGLSRSVDGRTLYATDGSSNLMYLDSSSLAMKEKKVLTCHGKPVAGVNELEVVPDFSNMGPALLGNVINTRTILVFNPSTALCIGSIDLSSLELENGEVPASEASGLHVANGIAYVSESNCLIVTGKDWNHMYEIALNEVNDDVMHPALLQRHRAKVKDNDSGKQAPIDPIH